MWVEVVSRKKASALLKSPRTQTAFVVYLSEDYVGFSALKREFSLHQFWDIGDRFHTLYAEVEKDLLKLSAKLNRQNDRDWYWSSSTASRNSVDTPFIREILFTLLGREVLENNQSRNIIFVVEHAVTGGLICAIAEKFGFEVRNRFSFVQKLIWPEMAIKHVKRSTFFLGYSLVRWVHVRRFKNARMPIESAKERLILRSWFTKGSIQGGAYVDRNFGILETFLKDKGRDVWVMPMTFNLGRNVLKNLEQFSRSSVQPLFHEQYLSPFVYFRALLRELRGLFLDTSGLVLRNIDFQAIIKWAHQLRAFAPATMEYSLTYDLLKELGRRETKIDRFVYTFENNQVEKILLKGGKRFLSRTRFVAFQHSVWYQEQPAMKVLPEELGVHPLPDEIVCHGTKYLNVLRDNGFPERLLRSGPNLRFSIVNETPMPEDTAKASDILIILNFDPNPTRELLEKTALALRDQHYSIRIKIHPLLNKTDLEHFLKSIAFPKYEWAEGKVQDLIPQSRAVIMGGSSVTNLETLCMGVPLVRIALNCNFNLDPLWDTSEMFHSASTPEEIRAQVQAACLSGQSEKLWKLGEFIKSTYFEPVAPGSLSAFL